MVLFSTSLLAAENIVAYLHVMKINQESENCTIIKNKDHMLVTKRAFIGGQTTSLGLKLDHNMRLYNINKAIKGSEYEEMRRSAEFQVLFTAVTLNIDGEMIKTPVYGEGKRNILSYSEFRDEFLVIVEPVCSHPY